VDAMQNFKKDCSIAGIEQQMQQQLKIELCVFPNHQQIVQVCTYFFPFHQWEANKDL